MDTESSGMQLKKRVCEEKSGNKIINVLNSFL